MRIELIDYGYTEKPKRHFNNDAGADVYAKNDIIVPGLSSIRVPLGFGLKLPDGLAAFVGPRSSLSSKGISCELAPVDSGYTGEIHAIVTNNTEFDYFISKNDRIGQLLIIPIVLASFEEGTEETRGNGAFGSTGK